MGLFEKYRRNDKEKRVHKDGLSYGEYPKTWSRELRQAQAARHFELMKDSVELVEKTLSEDTFRNRYEAAIREAQVVISLCGRTGIGIRAGRVLRYLQSDRERLVSEFAMRCAR